MNIAMVPIEYVSEVNRVDFPEEWYDANSEDHFWFQWRARVAEALIDRVGLDRKASHRVLDIGCGTGITCRQLSRTTSWTFEGADLNTDALSRCTGLSRRLYYNLLEQQAEFHQRYDVALLFDVIEHVDDTRAFLDAVFFHLKPGGVLLVNVPALNSLYSAYDVTAGHYRRYDRRTFAAEFKSSQLTLLDQVYWGLTMVPVLWLRKRVLKAGSGAAETIRQGFVPPSRVAHRMLKSVMQMETRLLTSPPLGTSIMGAVQAIV